MRRRLGWLGPAIVIAGVAVAGLGVWYLRGARPVPGAVIDTIRIDDRAAFVVRAEEGGERNFVELRDGDRLVWRALTPPYAGRPGAPGIAWNRTAATVRVLRNGRAEVFALSMHDAAKLGGFKLSPGLGPAEIATRGPVTLTDHVRSYELVSGAGWHQLVAIDLSTGEGVWKQDLGAAPVDDGGIDPTGPSPAPQAQPAGSPPRDSPSRVEAAVVWVRQAGVRRAFRVADGVEVSPKPS
jgi:hypothetical protein